MKKLYVVGMGPGDHDSMTIRADRVLRECDVIVGYTVYVELAEQYYPEKEFLTTPMRRETERCRLAFSEASKGRTTAMICSGDAGVYGMSGLIYELSEKYPEVEIEIVPGVSAVQAAALREASVGIALILLLRFRQRGIFPERNQKAPA